MFFSKGEKCDLSEPVLLLPEGGLSISEPADLLGSESEHLAEKRVATLTVIPGDRKASDVGGQKSIS